MSEEKKPEKKKKALDSFFKKGKKSSSKKKSDDDSSKQKEATSGWNIPEESAPSGAPKIQVKDLQNEYVLHSFNIRVPSFFFDVFVIFTSTLLLLYYE